uniref:Mannosyltransferase n=1 Tax=Haptolina brevifila TaxID=156173 RepID=A0A7S2N8E7_9EUKA
MGIVQVRGWARVPAWTAGVGAIVLSISAHKELRFLYPLVHPLLIGYAGVALRMMRSAHRRRWIIVLVATNAVAAAYLSLVHQRAPLALMATMRRNISLGLVRHLDVLTRCHQTPGFAQLHSPIILTYLHCPPPLAKALSFPASHGDGNSGSADSDGGSDRRYSASISSPGQPLFASTSQLAHRYPKAAAGCANDCDCFFSTPGPAVAQRYREDWWRLWRPGSWQRHSPLPSHVALFDELYHLPQVQRTLRRRGYVVADRFFHEVVWAGSGHRWPRWRVRQLVLLTRETR